MLNINRSRIYGGLGTIYRDGRVLSRRSRDGRVLSRSRDGWSRISC